MDEAKHSKETLEDRELIRFIDGMVVPILVERLMAETRHLYSVESSQYDVEDFLARAA